MTTTEKLLAAIRSIAADKRQKRVEPVLATQIEIYSLTGLSKEEQNVAAHALMRSAAIVCGETFNGVYYQEI